jgi:hypothetical protein
MINNQESGMKQMICTNSTQVIRVLLLSLSLVVMLPGCLKGEETTANETAPSEESLSGQAMLDLAARLNVPVGDIEAVREEAVTWRDGSLGCPKEGMMYTQALVEGSSIVLRVDDVEYHYHSGKGRAPFYCENPLSVSTRSSAE